MKFQNVLSTDLDPSIGGENMDISIMVAIFIVFLGVWGSGVMEKKKG